MTSETTNKFSPEVRERAVRMVLEHEALHPSRWATSFSIAAKIGCKGQTLNEWVKQAERDTGRRPGPTTEMAAQLKALERENGELRQANDTGGPSGWPVRAQGWCGGCAPGQRQSSGRDA